MIRWHKFLPLGSTASAGSTLVVAFALLGLLASEPSGALQDGSALQAQVSIATQIRQVQRATVDGRDFLTVDIGGHEIGPSTCRSNTLRMDSAGDAGINRQVEIENIAFTAMLTATTVMVVVPLEEDKCVDGKPTFTDLYPVTSRLQ